MVELKSRPQGVGASLAMSDRASNSKKEAAVGVAAGTGTETAAGVPGGAAQQRSAKETENPPLRRGLRVKAPDVKTEAGKG